MKLSIPAAIRSIAPYVPGKPMETLEREQGITGAVKLASNENPLGPSPMAVAAMGKALSGLNRYPDGAGYELTAQLAEALQVDPAQIVLGNGSDDLLALLARVLLQPGDEVIIPAPSFLLYSTTALSADARPAIVPLKEMTIDLEAMLARVTPKTRMVFICNPNNPTGTVVSRQDFERFLAALPEHVAVVVDEAYFEFVRDDRCVSGMAYLDAPVAVVTLRTFSKIYGLAGLRVGYGVMPAQLAEIIHRVRMPFNVNTLGQVAATAALKDSGFVDQTRSLVHQGLDLLYAELAQRGLSYFHTQANFFLIDVRQSAETVFQAMLRQGVIVRSMESYGYPNYIRINVGLPEENKRFLEALDKVLHES